MQKYVVEKKISKKILIPSFIFIIILILFLSFFIYGNIQKRKLTTLYDYISINDYDNASFVFRTLYEKEPFNKSVLAAAIDLYYEILIRSDSKNFVSLSSERVVSYAKQLMLVSLSARNNYIIRQKMAHSYESMGVSYYFEAYTEYKKAIGLGDKRTSTKIRLAEICYNLERYKESIVYYNLALNEKNISNIDIDFTDDIKYKFAKTYEADNNILEAINLFKDIFKNKKEDALYLSACLKLAELYNKQGVSDESIFYYKKAIDVDAKNADLYYNIGSIYLKDKKNADAKKMFNDALKIDRKHAKSISALRKLR